MPNTRKPSYEAIIVALAPTALFVALVAHPYLAGQLPNDTAVAAAVAADTTRWGLVHLAAGLASGLVILAFLAVRDYLRDAGDHGLSAVGVPFVVIGSTLFVMLAAMEFAPLAAAQAAGTDLADIAAAQAALEEWFVPVMVVGGLTFAIGVFAFIRSITTPAQRSRHPGALAAGLPHVEMSDARSRSPAGTRSRVTSHRYVDHRFDRHQSSTPGPS